MAHVPKGSLLIQNTGPMLTMQGEHNHDIGLLEHACLLIKDGVIEAVGNQEDVLQKQREVFEEHALPPVLDAGGKVIMPGFVDCHTHVVFGGSRVAAYAAVMDDDRPEVLAEKGIPSGIYASVNMTRDLPKEILKTQTKKRILNMALHGTTTMESKSGYGLTLESELKMLEVIKELHQELPLDIFPTFLGAHGWAEGMDKSRYIDILCQEMIPCVAERKLAVCNDVWCDEGHFTAAESERILSCGRQYGLAPRIHTDAYSYIGGSDLAAEMGMLSADHLNFTPPPVFQKLAKSGVVGVIEVGTDFAVKHPRPAVPRLMLQADMDLGLSTNCCPGCWCESMLFILILACRQNGMSPEEALRAATRGSAKAMGLSDRGMLAPGMVGDVLLLDMDTYCDLIYQYGRNPVHTVVKNGKVTISGGVFIN